MPLLLWGAKKTPVWGPLRPYTVELIPTLGALSPRGGPVKHPVLTGVRLYCGAASLEHFDCGALWRGAWS